MILYDTRLNQRFDSVMHPKAVVLLACWPHICISQSFELKCTSEIDHSSDLTRISDSGHVRHHVTVSKTAQTGLEKQTAVVQSQPQPALHCLLQTHTWQLCQMMTVCPVGGGHGTRAGGGQKVQASV